MNDLLATMRAMKTRIDNFDAKCSESHYTDTGEVWELLNAMLADLNMHIDRRERVLDDLCMSFGATVEVMYEDIAFVIEEITQGVDRSDADEVAAIPTTADFERCLDLDTWLEYIKESDDAESAEEFLRWLHEQGYTQ